MARKIVTMVICDRCSKEYEESGEPRDSDGKPLLYLEQKGHPPTKLEDLCPRCDGRVASLCEQIRLDKDDDKGSDSGAKKDKKPEAKKEKKDKKGGEKKEPPTDNNGSDDEPL